MIGIAFRELKAMDCVFVDFHRRLALRALRALESLTQVLHILVGNCVIDLGEIE